jgi:predicted ArsR family transcriptional regulator
VASLLSDGPATAAELSARLGITAAGVRKHLDSLEDAGDVFAGDRPPFGPMPGPRRGRPARIYALTDTGRRRFEQSYDDLAVSALRFLGQVDPSALAEFAQRRGAELEARYRQELDAISDPHARAVRLAELCDAEAAAFARLLDTNVTRLATIAHGDGVCTCLVSPAHATTERISR